MVTERASGTHSRAAQVNAADEDDLRGFLTVCCDIPSWVDAVSDGRPYADDAALLAIANDAGRRFTTDEVDRALAVHPGSVRRRSGTRRSRGGRASSSQRCRTTTRQPASSPR